MEGLLVVWVDPSRKKMFIQILQSQLLHRKRTHQIKRQLLLQHLGKIYNLSQNVYRDLK